MTTFEALTQDELVTATGGYAIKKTSVASDKLRTQVETLQAAVKDAAAASTTSAASKQQEQSSMMMMMMMMRR